MQRYLFWSFMLSGAAGHTYGAAGIWHASVEGDPGIDPVYDWTTWKEGMNYPGSTQLRLGKIVEGGENQLDPEGVAAAFDELDQLGRSAAG